VTEHGRELVQTGTAHVVGHVDQTGNDLMWVRAERTAQRCLYACFSGRQVVTKKALRNTVGDDLTRNTGVVAVVRSSIQRGHATAAVAQNSSSTALLEVEPDTDGPDAKRILVTVRAPSFINLLSGKTITRTVAGVGSSGECQAYHRTQRDTTLHRVCGHTDHCRVG